MALRIDDVRLLLTAVEEGSMSRAAQRSFITQQGLSSAIRRVENSIGCQVLERHASGVRLTALGREMYDALSAIVSNADTASRLARQLPSSYETITVGVTSPAAVGSISELHGALPHARIHVRQLNFDQLGRTLTHHTADLVITFGPLTVPGWRSARLYSERLGLLLPRMHRLAQEKSVDLDAVLGEVFLSGANLPQSWPQIGRLDAFRSGRPARLGDPDLTDVRNPAEANEMVAARLALVTAPMSHGRFFPHPLVSLVPLKERILCDAIILNGIEEQDGAKHRIADTITALLTAMR